MFLSLFVFACVLGLCFDVVFVPVVCCDCCCCIVLFGLFPVLFVLLGGWIVV